MAATPAQKLTFANKARDTASRIALAREYLKAQAQAYNDRGFQPGGADYIKDSDIEAAGITAAQLAALMDDFETEFEKLMSNQATTAIQGEQILNMVRGDL